MTRLLLCLFALPLLQDGEAARIAALIAGLDDDSIDLREQAVRDLVAIGAPALAPLAAALESAPNPEVRIRIESAISRIRSR